MLRRITSTLLACIALLGCGFDPLYGQRGEQKVINQFAYLRVAKIKDRVGQQFRNELLHQLHSAGKSKQERYKLVASLEESSSSLAVRKSAFATRANLTVTAKYSLLSSEFSEPLLASSANATVSYNIYTSEFATLIARREAQERAIKALSKDIVIRLAIFFESQ